MAFTQVAPFLELASQSVTPGTGKQFIYPKTDGFWYTKDDAGIETLLGGGGTANAPANATYITQVANSGLSAEQALSSLATGLMKVTTATGVVSSITDSAGLAGVISDETGTGALVFATTPTLTGSPVVATTYADPVANQAMLTLTATQTQSADNAFRTRALSISAVLNNSSFNNTAASNGMIANSVAVTVSGTAGTVSQVAPIQTAATVTGGVTLTTLRSHAIGAPTVSGGSVVTNHAAIQISVQTAATNNTYLLMGTTSVPSGNWAIHSTSATDSALAGNLSIGQTSAPAAALDVLTADAATNTVVNVGILGHTGGTVAANFGTGLLFTGEDSTTPNTSMMRLRALYTTVTHASYATRSVLSAYDSTGERDVIGWGANGSAAIVGFLAKASAPIAVQTSGADLTNSVTSGGSSDVIADFTSLTVYATDAATIRNDIYQLARKLKQVNDALRAFGLLS